MTFDLVLLGDMSWPPSIIVCDPGYSMTRLGGLDFPAGSSDIKAICTPPWALGPRALTVALTTLFFCQIAFLLGAQSSSILTTQPPLQFLCKPPSSLLPTTPSRMSPSLFYGPVALGSSLF